MRREGNVSARTSLPVAAAAEVFVVVLLGKDLEARVLLLRILDDEEDEDVVLVWIFFGVGIDDDDGAFSSS
jgi:hypothetical protein